MLDSDLQHSSLIPSLPPCVHACVSSIFGYHTMHKCMLSDNTDMGAFPYVHMLRNSTACLTFPKAQGPLHPLGCQGCPVPLLPHGPAWGCMEPHGSQANEKTEPVLQPLGDGGLPAAAVLLAGREQGGLAGGQALLPAGRKGQWIMLLMQSQRQFLTTSCPEYPLSMHTYQTPGSYPRYNPESSPEP